MHGSGQVEGARGQRLFRHSRNPGRTAASLFCENSSRPIISIYARTSAWQRRASKPSSMCSLARCRNRESMELFGVGAASAIARGAFQTPPPSRGRRPVICTVSGARFRNPGTLGTFVLCFLQNSEGTSRGNASIQNACGGRHVSALPLIGPGANGIRTTRHNS